MNPKISFTLFSIILSQISWGESAKIFFMIPLTSISEKQVYIPLIDSLAERGHEVVVASIVKSKYKSKKNIREFVPITYKEWIGDAFSNPVESRKQEGRYTSLSLTDFSFITEGCEKVYETKEFQEVLKEKFDLVFRNTFGGPCFNGALYRFEAPFIILNTFIPYTEHYELSGMRLPASFTPFPLGPARSRGKMSFFDRLENVLLDIHWALFNKYWYYPAMEEVYRKYLGNDIPGVEEIQKNVSLGFSNAHFTMSVPAPVMPDIIEIGGIQCLPTKPLPKDIDEFLTGAKEGFVYFSMGSMINSQYFSEEMRQMFLGIFAKLKQRVLWKFEAQLDNLPPNVKIGKWLPQNDILGHPNIRLFITHGGGLSTQEAIYNGVPLVSIPIFADQNLNAKNAEENGFAVVLELLELSSEKLETAIKTILNNPKYAENAKAISFQFRDQPMTPLERAIYWTEYVIRHKGTKHLQSSARELNFIEYHLLDVTAFLVVIFLAILYLTIATVRKVIGVVTGSMSSKDAKKKRQ